MSKASMKEERKRGARVWQCTIVGPRLESALNPSGMLYLSVSNPFEALNARQEPNNLHALGSCSPEFEEFEVAES